MGHGKNYEVVRRNGHDPEKVTDKHLSASGARAKAQRRDQARELGSSDSHGVRKTPPKK